MFSFSGSSSSINYSGSGSESQYFQAVNQLVKESTLVWKFAYVNEFELHQNLHTKSQNVFSFIKRRVMISAKFTTYLSLNLLSSC